MEPIVITDKERLAELLWSLEDAGILSKDVSAMVEVLHKKFGKKDWPSEEAYNRQFNEGFADLILERYDSVVIMPDERVMGRSGDTDEQIFDGRILRFT